MEIKKSNKIAIVVIGYNRLNSLKRLLSSVAEAIYPDNEIPLVISIDCSNNEELYNYVQNFKWNYGPKYLNIQTERLGLKRHIYQCISLSQYFKGVVLLEDDLYVSPYFYDYVEQVIDKYGEEDIVSEISLYNHEENGFVGMPFSPLNNGSDVYLAQHVSTWGECFTYQMWQKFSTWLDKHEGDSFEDVDIPVAVKQYTRAWSKYYNAYLVSTGRYVIFPYISLTTNFSDAGEHGGNNNSIVQVSLLQGEKKYYFKNVDGLVMYDSFSQNLAIPLWLGLKPEDLVIDFYGMKDKYDRKYVLTSFKLPYKKIHGFALNMRPWELNIKYGIKGNDIILYQKTISKETFSKKVITYNVHEYFLRRYSVKSLLTYSIKKYFKRLVAKFV